MKTGWGRFVLASMVLLNRGGGRWGVRHLGKGGGGMKGSVEKKDRAGSRMKGSENGRIQRWREIEKWRDEHQ